MAGEGLQYSDAELQGMVGRIRSYGVNVTLQPYGNKWRIGVVGSYWSADKVFEGTLEECGHFLNGMVNGIAFAVTH